MTRGDGHAYPARRLDNDRGRSWLLAEIGVIAVVMVWELVALAMTGRHSVVPTPLAVMDQLWKDRALYPPQIVVTLREAGWGWLWGNLTAIGLALMFVLVPLVESTLLKIAVVSYCMPIIAIGPILEIVFTGEEPKIVLAALSVLFTTLIGALQGLRAADPVVLDLVRAAGGGSVAQLRKVRVRAALPSTFAGLQIAAPAALLGAIIGQFLGGERGLGVFMVASESAFNVDRTWGIALVCTLIALVGYLVTGAIGRALTPWAHRLERA